MEFEFWRNFRNLVDEHRIERKVIREKNEVVKEHEFLKVPRIRSKRRNFMVAIMLGTAAGIGLIIHKNRRD